MSTVAKLTPAPLSQGTKRTEHQPVDPIFFRKVDIFVGQKLLYMGRSAPNTVWKVKSIQTDAGKKGYKYVDVVHKLADYVVLSNGVEVKQMTFGYMSYSAIWRLA